MDQSQEENQDQRQQPPQRKTSSITTIQNTTSNIRTALQVVKKVRIVIGIIGGGVPLIIIIIVIIIVLIILLGESSFLQQPSPPPTSQQTDIAGCDFTRGDVNPPAAKYNSPLLLSYFTDAAAASGVPASVLAGIARIESPGAVDYTDTTLATMPCAESPTGALGLMQLEPQGKPGNDPAALALGASYLGLQYSDLTRANYCDIRQNIFLAAGLINQKRIYATGVPWNPVFTNDPSYINSVAQTYYGCLLYPSCVDGPYSYGTDLYTSVNSCSVKNGINPPGEQNTSNAIVSAAASILPLLQKGPDGFFDVKISEPGVFYWCTYLIIDSYTNAGFAGLDRSSDGSVYNMLAYFKDTAGNGGHYKVAPPDTSVLQLQPGNVIFFAGTDKYGNQEQHVSLINTVVVDQNGNGAINTYESNNVIEQDVVSVRNYIALKASTTSYTILGFGQVVK